ncbi:MAG: aspartyl/asparaginyl beta-hydroxylase domain-containing protein [Bdellovibrionales bacterium]|nr:aspartyl/asparaginyl beta-hydroxylase domain-containing protein [Bdellovibrionales bacterium]NQZ17987.1 aspartyl/asparaginyl beta-hydroxylase domain-containing protein [Bdellovibrionales bacterium]
MDITSHFRTFILENNNQKIPKEFESFDFNIAPEVYPKKLIDFFTEAKLEVFGHDVDFSQILRENDDCASVLKKLSALSIKYLKLGVDWPFEDVQKEALAIDRSEYKVTDPYGRWMAAPLHSYIHDPTSMKSPKRLEKLGLPDPWSMDWTEFAEKCPKTVEWIKNDPLYKNIHRVGFLILEPGGYVKPHSDYDNPALSGVNYAITHPKECYWTMKEYGSVDFKAGDCILMDYSPYHSVINLSNETRIHMLRGGHFDMDYLLEVLRKTYL